MHMGVDRGPALHVQCAVGSMGPVLFSLLALFPTREGGGRYAYVYGCGSRDAALRVCEKRVLGAVYWLCVRLPVRRLSSRTLELETAFLSDTERDGQRSTLCNM
jgi:hypothetical protein